MLTEANVRQAFEAAAHSVNEYPGGFEGRGIVIPAGGARYFPCAWVNVNMLRHVGCKLPIELWHLGPEELSEEMRGLLEPLGVTCVDALELRRTRPARILNGWELKCYAILHSCFSEVLLLDADNHAVVDPEFLFDAPEYKRAGAVFWPDFGRLAPSREIWKLTGVPYRNEPEFETGQILVNKRSCWAPLSLAMWMNEHSDFWYRHIHGDKDTFHFAWRKLDIEYAMPSRPIHPLCLPGRTDGVMCQHDFEGRRVFQHRNFGKWTLSGINPQIRGFLFERECLKYLKRLQASWVARPGRAYDDEAAGHEERRAAHRLCQRQWVYRRVGYDERLMSFGLNGRITRGAGARELTWALHFICGKPALSIQGLGGLTCVLVPNDYERWYGRWLVQERMPIDLVTAAGPRLDTEPTRTP